MTIIYGIVFAHAKQNDYFVNSSSVDKSLLEQIKNLTYGREVSACSANDWESAILQSYRVWNSMCKNRGGILVANLLNRTVDYKFAYKSANLDCVT